MCLRCEMLGGKGGWGVGEQKEPRAKDQEQEQEEDEDSDSSDFEEQLGPALTLLMFFV